MNQLKNISIDIDEKAETKKVVGYKVNDEETLQLISYFHEGIKNVFEKENLKEILSTKTINSDNASFLMLLVQEMLDGDIFKQEHQDCPTATLGFKKLYRYLSEFFTVKRIDINIGYICIDKRTKIASMYFFNDESDGKVA